MRVVFLRKTKNHLQFVFSKRDYKLLIDALDSHIQSFDDLLAEDFITKSDIFHFKMQRAEALVLRSILKRIVQI